MTKEEAIQVLNMVEAHGSLVIQAKEMAIKALGQEPRKGHWIEHIERDDWNDYEEQYLECSQCHYIAAEQAFNYCPNCGADMREV